ncbi:MAG TPA: transcription-repair coupling factor [Vicinamibacteria bacterium]|nr:transcription-repair coupling factor [Vicinamibacteria bacterium]
MSALVEHAAAAEVAAAREELRAGGEARLSGLEGPAALLFAALVEERPLLVVTPFERDVEELASDLRTLSREAGAPGEVLPFPAPGPLPYRGLPRHPEASLRRATALLGAGRGRLRALVASPEGLLRGSLPRERLLTRAFSLRAGEEMAPEILLEALVEAGYAAEDPVTGPGQMARRGGVLDVFPPDRDTPVRLEFFGDTLDSVRAFDVATQRSLSPLEEIEVLPLADAFATRETAARLADVVEARFGATREGAAFLERLRRGLAQEQVADLLGMVPGALAPPWAHVGPATAVVLDPEAVAAEAVALHTRAREERARREGALVPEVDEALLPAAALLARLAEAPRLLLLPPAAGAEAPHVAARPARRYAGDLRALLDALRKAPAGLRHVLYLGNPGRAERLKDVLRENGLEPDAGRALTVRVGALSRGFELPSVGLVVLADGDVFPEEVHLHPRGRARGVRSALQDFRDLRVGDLVVHEEHGIGRFEGLETLSVEGLLREFMVVSYQGGDKLKVPVDAFDRVEKYRSSEAARPALDRLGGGGWEKVKRRVKKAMRDMAAELLRLYAERKARPGHAFTAMSPWQHEFEEAFEYEETPDQAQAIADVARDMASSTPMDRLVLGDVGYGKTEVAMRAAMRAVLDGKQVAVLAPTTVLAFQHWKTFRKRLAPFPVKVEMVSRMRGAREIRAALQALAQGQVDVLIGTHRLLSRDVVFRDLGLLVVDEEQRFGVAAKEKLKKLRAQVDCLTLSATPIPRTLQMGLSGIRDMSVIETPPKDRLAIHTSIVKFSTDVIAAAIRQELQRGGQVFFVHSRVESLYSVAALVKRLVPEARVVVGHGQLPEAQLEKAMLSFVEGRADVLVATTIIENGLDIPRANTLLVNRADRFGLAQLYQLRGRVGRSDRRAYAYLLVPPATVLSPLARKRLAAIQEFSELGAGFRIAALDLELRGAGNLLGGEQSGHIQAVGLDLYIKLLEQTVMELKGEAPLERPRAALNLRVDLRLPADYVPETHQRLTLYKRVSQLRSGQEADALREELRDRYGPPPPALERLFQWAALRLRAESLGVVQADLGRGALHLRFAPDAPVPPEALVAAARALPGASFSPQGVLGARLLDAETGLAGLERVLLALEDGRPRL